MKVIINQTLVPNQTLLRRTLVLHNNSFGFFLDFLNNPKSSMKQLLVLMLVLPV